MGRPNGVRYRADRDAWVSKVGGSLVTLARGRTNKAEAVRALHKLLGETRTDDAGVTVREAADRFLEWTERERSEETLKFYRKHLVSFLASVGPKLAMSELRPVHVIKWIDSHETWNTNSRKNAVVAAKRLTGWAKKVGLAENTLDGMEMPRTVPKQKVQTGDQARRLIASARTKEFYDVITFIHETGCRVCEATRVTAADYDPKAGVVRMTSKSTWITRKERVIYLTEGAKEVVERVAKERPEGPIFRNTAGNPWTVGAIGAMWRRLREKTGDGEGSSPGTLRHLFVTDALENGIPIAHVSQLVGHTSTQMVSRVYSKLHERETALAESLGALAAKRTETASRRSGGSSGPVAADPSSSAD